MSIDKKALKMAEQAIIKSLGNLDDLPYEIANVVCNVYYRYFSLFTDQSFEDVTEYVQSFDFLTSEDSDNPFTIARLNISALEGLRKEETLKSKAAAELICLTKVIDSLRLIGKHSEPKYYFLLLDIIVSVFKYRIKNVFKKTLMRMKIEMKLRKHQTNEISHLVDFMNVRNEDDELDIDYYNI